MTRRIADYAHDLSFEDIPAGVIAAAKTRLVDTLGCAIGGRDSDPVYISRKLAKGGAPDLYAGRIFGTRERTSAEAATFVNTCMIRYLDFNDAIHGGHPSDMSGALLALADGAGIDGKRLLSALVVAYEVHMRLVKTTEMRERGWDQGFAIGIGTVAGVGHLLDLSAEKIGHALAITCTGNVPMRASRAGLLSHWKGAATAYSCRNAVFATLLAAEGMTGPDNAFEGRHGLWEQITGPFELPAWANEGGDWFLLKSKMKYWPVEGNTLTAVWMALELRNQIKGEDIAAIDIDTHWSGWHETASEPEKWNPTSRETADHSMPYIFARTFLDGGITVKSFEPELVSDPLTRPLMNKIRVHNSEEINAIYKSTYPFTYVLRATVTGTDGNKFPIEVRNPRGTPQNPMTDDEVDAKFRGLTTPVLGAERTGFALSLVRSIETAVSAAALMDAFVIE
ncbi:MAG TPA: MmgE/PrpD family protein [Devosia sp.]|nr:MmgE/PrpD family protein [Devosia sp.]